MNDTNQEEPEDPEADVDDEDNTGNCQAADEGYSEEYYLSAPGDQQQQQADHYIMGRNSRPSAHLQMASQFTEEDIANENEEQT